MIEIETDRSRRTRGVLKRGGIRGRGDRIYILGQSGQRLEEEREEDEGDYTDFSSDLQLQITSWSSYAGGVLDSEKTTHSASFESSCRKLKGLMGVLITWLRMRAEVQP